MSFLNIPFGQVRDIGRRAEIDIHHALDGNRDRDLNAA